MRLLADENIPVETVRALRLAGHDVVSASEADPGAPDLAVRGSLRPRAGVLLLRIVPKHADEVTDLLVDLLARDDLTWSDHLSVVGGQHVRQRPI